MVGDRRPPAALLLAAAALVVSAATDDTPARFDCPAPRSPHNGYALIFHDGGVVRYACRPGYGLRGRHVSYCVGARWSNPIPTCDPLYQEFSSKTSYSNENTKEILDLSPIKNQPTSISGEVNELNSEEDASLEALRQEQKDSIRRYRINQRFQREQSLPHRVPYNKGRLRWGRRGRKGHHKRKWPRGKKKIIINKSVNINSPGFSENSIFRNYSNGSYVNLEREGYIRPLRMELTDSSCFEILPGGTPVPIRAPELPHASVVGYHRVQRGETYLRLFALVARYRCHHGFVPRDPTSNSLLCQDGEWRGDRIDCISTSAPP